MTAIDAAILELEAHREHTAQLIAAMRRFARVIEDAHDAKGPTVRVDEFHVHTSRQEARELWNTRSGQAPSASNSARGAVLACLRATPLPLRLVDVVAKTALPRETVRQELKDLVADSQVKAQGKTSAKTYALVQPRSGPAAGTPSGPAGGSGPDFRRAPEFETVWNGTKERNGEAPTILPPRGRKP